MTKSSLATVAEAAAGNKTEPTQTNDPATEPTPAAPAVDAAAAPLTAEQVAANHPAAADALRAEGAAAERDRVTSILSATAGLGLESLAVELVSTGASLVDAQGEIIDRMRAGGAAPAPGNKPDGKPDFAGMDAAAAGGVSQPASATGAPGAARVDMSGLDPDSAEFKDAAQANYEASPALRGDYPEFEDYLAFAKNDAKGFVRIQGNRKAA